MICNLPRSILGGSSLRRRKPARSSKQLEFIGQQAKMGTEKKDDDMARPKLRQTNVLLERNHSIV
jgi:hypothetical protein